MLDARRKLITTADDFGLSVGVNEAVCMAAERGILTSASLMVAGPAAADAVARAHAMPGLAVGLHLVVIEGDPVSPHDLIAELLDRFGRFPSDQLQLGLRYAFSVRARRQLAAEIRAQFEAFRATGLVLDHVNAHKHMHLHPVVGAMMISIGQEFGLHAVRVPAEPAVIGGAPQSMGDRALRHWSKVLRAQARRAGMLTNDSVLGLGWTGAMTQLHTQRLLNALPPGLVEMYFHPATSKNQLLSDLMPTYDHQAELEALLTCHLPPDAKLTTYNAER